MGEKRRIISNTLANGLAQFTTMVSSLIFMPLLIRAFGVADFGLFLLASSVAAYASLVDFGVGTALTKNVAEKAASEDREGIGRYTSTALLFYAAAGLLVAAVLCALAFASGVVFKVTPDGARLLRNLLLIAGVTSLFTWPGSTANYVLAGLQRYTLTASTAVFVAIANIGVILYVLASHRGPVVLLLGQSLVGIVGMVLNVFYARRAIADVRVHPSEADLTVFRDIVSFSWVIFVLQICTIIIYQQTDRIVLGVFLGATAITLYEAAGKMQGLITQLTQFAASAVMPFASQLAAEGRESSSQTLLLRGTKYVMALVMPVVLGLMILASPIITHWLGPAFAKQAPAAQVLLSYQLLTIGAVIGDSILIGRGHARRRLFNSVFVVTLGNLALSIILVQRIGIMGVVVGTAAPWIVDFPFRLHVGLSEVGVSVRRWFTAAAGPVYLSLIATAAVTLAAYRTPLVGSLWGLAITLALGVAASWACLAVFALTPVERGEISALVKRLATAVSR